MEYLAFRKLNYIVPLKWEKKNYLNYDSHLIVWSCARSGLSSAETSTASLPSSALRGREFSGVPSASWPLSLGKNFWEAPISIFGIYRPKCTIKCNTVKQAYKDEIAIMKQRKKCVNTLHRHTLLSVEQPLPSVLWNVLSCLHTFPTVKSDLRRNTCSAQVTYLTQGRGIVKLEHWSLRASKVGQVSDTPIWTIQDLD